MLDDPSNPADPDGAGPPLSWQERELVGALKRLANARSQLSSLQAEGATVKRRLEQTDIDALREARFELDRLQGKAKARFGGGSARERVRRLEETEHQILERMGFASYDEFEAWRIAPESGSDLDPAILAFARRELEQAEAAWHQIQDLELPPPEPAEVDHDQSDAADDDADEHIRFTRPAAS